MEKYKYNLLKPLYLRSKVNKLTKMWDLLSFWARLGSVVCAVFGDQRECLLKGEGVLLN